MNKNINNTEFNKVKVSNRLTCCICGESITHDTSHDPYPVRPESWYGEMENRCCSICNTMIVFPIRLRLGRNGGGFRKPLMKMNHKELKNFVVALRNQVNRAS